MMSAQKGEKFPKFADKQYRFCGRRRRGCRKNPKMLWTSHMESTLRVILYIPDEGVTVAAAHVSDALVLANEVGEEDEAGGDLEAIV